MLIKYYMGFVNVAAMFCVMIFFLHISISQNDVFCFTQVAYSLKVCQNTVFI